MSMGPGAPPRWRRVKTCSVWSSGFFGSQRRCLKFGFEGSADSRRRRERRRRIERERRRRAEIERRRRRKNRRRRKQQEPPVV